MRRTSAEDNAADDAAVDAGVDAMADKSWLAGSGELGSGIGISGEGRAAT
jgi:hypothetical protein